MEQWRSSQAEEVPTPTLEKEVGEFCGIGWLKMNVENKHQVKAAPVGRRGMNPQAPSLKLFPEEEGRARLDTTMVPLPAPIFVGPVEPGARRSESAMKWDTKWLVALVMGGNPGRGGLGNGWSGPQPGSHHIGSR